MKYAEWTVWYRVPRQVSKVLKGSRTRDERLGIGKVFEQSCTFQWPHLMA